MLTHQVASGAAGGVGAASSCPPPTSYFPGTETTTWYNASQYFQKSGVSDMNGHTTAMGVGTSTDANVGNRGQVLWVQDAGYNDSSSPSYHKQFIYTYNQYGQKLTDTNLNGVVTQYTCGDQWGNLTQVVQDPGTGHLNRTTTMSYDAAGRVLQSTDPAGQTSTFTYNTLGQPLTVATPAKGATPAETITYVYDANGRTHSVQDNRGTTVMAYEPGCDRVHSVTDPVTGTTGYTYLSSGERTSMTLPGGGTWTYSYLTTWSGANEGRLPSDDPNSAGTALGSITDAQGRKTEYAFDGSGRLRSARSDEVYNAVGTLVSCVQTDLTYEGVYSTVMAQTGAFTHGWLGQVTTSFRWLDTSGSQPQWRASLLSSNAYTYDNAGNRLTNQVTMATTGTGGALQYSGGSPAYSSTTQPDLMNTGDAYTPVTNQLTTSRTETYTYDALNRLKTVNYGDGQTQSYTFDAMGNRLSRQDSAVGTTSYSYNAANMLLSTGGAGASGFNNDADGNTLTGNGRTNTWDSQNRLVSCIINGNTTAYKYGADGLRRQSAKNGVSTDYAYDGTMLVREGHAAGGTLTAATVTATYLVGARGPECRVDETQQTEGYYFGGTPTTPAPVRGRGLTKWYVYDGLGSVVGEVDPSGNLTSSPKYDVYGATRSNGGTASTKQGFVGSLGHVSDDTGLVYMRARYYDPSLGRFVSQDPDMEGMDWFVYASNNPVNMVDPTGCDATINGEDAFNKAMDAFAIALMAHGKELMGIGWANIWEGMANMIYGELLDAAGTITYPTPLGMLAGLPERMMGQLLKASGGRQAKLGCMQCLTGALDVWAGQMILNEHDLYGDCLETANSIL